MPNTLKICGTTKFIAIFCIVIAGWSKVSPVAAQNIDQMIYQNQMNMQQNDQMLNGMLADAQRRAEFELQSYINSNRAQLTAETQQYNQMNGQNLSVEMYARAKVQEAAARNMNAAQGGTNPMFEQQKQMFESGQRAHQARQNAADANMQNWYAGQNQIEAGNQAWNNQQRSIDSDNNRFIQQGIQGNQYYRNTETGEVAELPFAGDTGVYGDSSGNTWVSPQMGQYNQIGPNGMPQQMEGFDPDYYE